MFKSSVFVVTVLLSVSALAGKNKKIPRYMQDPSTMVVALEDSSLVSAVKSQKRVDYIEAQDMKVVQLLPDDTKGLPHQKFNVELSDGSTVTIVSNLDMCPDIPVRVGDLVGAGGQFIPTGKRTGVLHWVHRDPKQRRPDGYVELNGQIYCK